MCLHPIHKAWGTHGMHCMVTPLHFCTCPWGWQAPWPPMGVSPCHVWVQEPQVGGPTLIRMTWFKACWKAADLLVPPKPTELEYLSFQRGLAPEPQGLGSEAPQRPLIQRSPTTGTPPGLGDPTPTPSLETPLPTAQQLCLVCSTHPQWP